MGLLGIVLQIKYFLLILLIPYLALGIDLRGKQQNFLVIGNGAEVPKRLVKRDRPLRWNRK